jgi:hypothetical protein
MEVLRGRALADVGDSRRRQAAPSPPPSTQNPDHVEALGSFATSPPSEEDWAGAEGAWIRLARLATEPAKQADIYLQLGEIYDERLPNPERAELAYQEILKRCRERARARAPRRPLRAHRRLARAAPSSRPTWSTSAEAPEDKCVRTTELASIYETSGDAKKAEATLLARARPGPRTTSPSSRSRASTSARASCPRPTCSSIAPSPTRAAPSAPAASSRYLFETVATRRGAARQRRRRARRARPPSPRSKATTPSSMARRGRGRSRARRPPRPRGAHARVPRAAPPHGPVARHRRPLRSRAVRARPSPRSNPSGRHHPQARRGYRLHLHPIHVTGLGPCASRRTRTRRRSCSATRSSPRTAGRRAQLPRPPRAQGARRQRGRLRAHRAHRSVAPGRRVFPAFSAHLDPAGRRRRQAHRLLRSGHPRPRQGPSDPQLGLLAAEVIGSIGNRASTLNTVVNGWGNRVGAARRGRSQRRAHGIAWAGGNTNAPPPRARTASRGSAATPRRASSD